MAVSNQLLTVTEAAAVLKLGRTLVYELVLRGDLKSIKIGRARRIPASAVDEFIRERLADPSEEDTAVAQTCVERRSNRETPLKCKKAQRMQVPRQARQGA